MILEWLFIIGCGFIIGRVILIYRSQIPKALRKGFEAESIITLKINDNEFIELPTNKVQAYIFAHPSTKIEIGIGVKDVS